MTRKKTTTGTMGSKRKTEAKVETTTKAKDKPAGGDVAGKAASPKRAEQKANEVIPEVACALLEANPSLPDQALILEEFSQHFRSAAARAEALATASAAAVKAAPGSASEGEKQRGAERKRRPTVEPPSRLAPRATSSYEPPPAAAAAPVAAEIAPVSDPIIDEPAPELVANDPEPEEVSMFAALEAEATREPEDLFALLAADPTTSRATDDDFDFSYQSSSDQSSPFLAAAPLRDDSATVMVSAVEDDAIFGTPIAQEALPAEPVPATIAPNESTMMIQAMPDDEPAEAAATSKSRKSSKKRRG